MLKTHANISLHGGRTMGFLQERSLLKKVVLACSTGYFLLIILLVVMQMNGLPVPPPNSGRVPITIDAFIGLIWGLRKDEPTVTSDVTEPPSETDPILQLGRHPIDEEVTDASVNHDRYINRE